jgi:type III secretory pathway component EscS
MKKIYIATPLIAGSFCIKMLLFSKTIVLIWEWKKYTLLHHSLQITSVLKCCYFSRPLCWFGNEKIYIATPLIAGNFCIKMLLFCKTIVLIWEWKKYTLLHHSLQIISVLKCCYFPRPLCWFGNEKNIHCYTTHCR